MACKERYEKVDLDFLKISLQQNLPKAVYCKDA
jgi:hypothetical protein